MNIQETEDVTNQMEDNRFIIDQNNEQSTKKIKPDFSVSNKGWVPDKTKKDYHNQRLFQSRWAFFLSIIGCIIGFIVIIFGMIKSIYTNNVEWIAIMSGGVVDGIAALFFYLNNKANDKISEFFKELTLDSNKKDAQKLIYDIKNDNIRDELIVKLALHLSGIDDEKICKNTKEVCKNDNETT